jgi:hypothetical protein
MVRYAPLLPNIPSGIFDEKANLRCCFGETIAGY